MRRFKNNNIIKGVIIGGLLFGTITGVLATGMSANEIQYNAINTVADALDDLYDMTDPVSSTLFNGLSFKYYANNIDNLDQNTIPNGAHDVNDLGYNYYIRTTLKNGAVVGNSGCIKKDNIEYCVSPSDIISVPCENTVWDLSGLERQQKLLECSLDKYHNILEMISKIYNTTYTCSGDQPVFCTFSNGLHTRQYISSTSPGGTIQLSWGSVLMNRVSINASNGIHWYED